jgi:hypothetical protein
MTPEQRDMIVVKTRENVGEVFETFAIGTTVVLNLLDEHPELAANVGEFLRKYWSLFKPLLQEATQDGIDVRVAQFRAIKAELKLSDELTVKLITGR